MVASPPGAIGLPQHVHIVNINVAGLSVMMNFLGVGLLIVALPYKSFEMRQKKEECAASNPLKPLQDKYAPSKQCSSVYRSQNHLLQRCSMELWQVSDLHEVRFVEESQSHIVALRGTLGMCQPPRSFTSCIAYLNWFANSV